MSQQENYTRPTTIEEVHERMKDLATPEGWQRGLAYKPESHGCIYRHAAKMWNNLDATDRSRIKDARLDGF
jgi:hypothetical protein